MNSFKKAWKGFMKGWMKFAHILGKINSTIILTILYFVVVGIYAILLRIFKVLVWPFTRGKKDSYWVEKKIKFDPESHKYPF